MGQEIISNIKAYNFHWTFKQNIKETNSQDKQSLRDCYIKRVIHYIKEFWDEISKYCISSLACNDFYEFYEAIVSVVINDIFKHADEGRIQNVNAENLEKLIEQW